MEAELIDEKTIPKGHYDGLTMSKEDFLTWQPDNEPFVYEFNDGVIESKPALTDLRLAVGDLFGRS